MNLFTIHWHRWLLYLLFVAILAWPLPTNAAPAPQPRLAPLTAPATNRIMTASQAAATDLEEAAQAIVRIEAVGTFVYPKEGAQAGTHGGSGFIIDPSGLAVTNNHVVTGAAYLSVYLSGETKARNAKVLGVDECADLAVIDIEGDGFPYLAWSTTALKVGTPVYAAGYPLGDPEYTLTSGIISKAQANGQTSWASLDYVLQHDASLNPGNSGGALLDEGGQVVGINYASNQANQYFAISGELAQPIIAHLRTGVNLDTIGINGTAFSDGADVFGVWVFSVRSGSPADETGVQPGDILFEMEGVPVGSGATMETYCDILRGHDADDVIALKVWRNPGEIWGGQLNGRSLSLLETVPTPATPTATAEPASEQPAPPATPTLVPPTVAPSDPPTATPTATPTPAPQAFATVKLATLNVRNGPGTNYAVVGSVRQQERLLVVGRANDRCDWLQVQLTDGKTGWIAGPPTYAELEGNCSAIALVATLPPPPPPAKPCVRFDNHFNKVADVTLTRPDNPNWHQKFDIAPHKRSTQCLEPGRYTFSVGVPGVGSGNDEFTLVKGGRLLIIPIY